MILQEHLPEIDPANGSLRDHPTGGEHTDKFIQCDSAINRFRGMHLSHLDETPIQPIDNEAWADMLFEDQTEVVIIDNLDRPGAESRYDLLAGYAIAGRSRPSRFEKHITVTEFAVRADMRRQGLAGYMLHRTITSEYFGSVHPTQLIIDLSTYQTPDWLEDNLLATGFTRSSNGDSALLYLPGTRFWPRGDMDDSANVTSILDAMPEDWNGYIDLYPETDPQTAYFRNGTLLGTIRRVNDSCGHDDDDHLVWDFNLADPGNKTVATLKGLTVQQAAIALYKNYGLLQP